MELDFLGLKEQSRPKQRNSVKGLQRAMSKIDPQVLRAVFATDEGSADECRRPIMSTATDVNKAAPVLFQSSRPGLPDKASEAAPLTIFYQGAVAVFNLSHEKSIGILKLAEKSKTTDSTDELQSIGILKLAEKAKTTDSTDELEVDLSLDMPIARKRSLIRFLEKRRDRLVSSSPYHCGSSNGIKLVGA